MDNYNIEDEIDLILNEIEYEYSKKVITLRDWVEYQQEILKEIQKNEELKK
jgi:hypothetical protein